MFKPMLADPVDLKLLKYPVVASPKLDGVRAIMINGMLVSRNLKPFANKAINANFSHKLMLDGELIVGDPRDKACFRNTMKVVSAFDADISELRFHVFDAVAFEMCFKDRFETAAHAIRDYQRLVHVPHAMVPDEKALLNLEEKTLDEGFEGLMLRDPTGVYKFGRSTAREGGLLKLKRKLTSEARVIGFVEQMHNANEAKIDNLGHTERSSHQANLVPMGVLGALQVRDLTTSVEFNIGTGFTAEERAAIWRAQESFKGKVVTYEYLPIGVKDKPRHPAFLGWRMEADL